MAKYTITHSCGHDSEEQLYGPTRDREGRIEWLSNRPCTACWRTAKRAEDATKPITLTVATNGLDKDAEGNVLAEIVLTGGTEPRKDAIKALGYVWGEPRGGILNMLSASAPGRAWIKRIPLLTLAERAPALLAEIRAIDPRAEGRVEINPLDIEMARRQIAEREARLTAHPKPERPAWYAALMAAPEAQWNGKIYGKAQYGYRIYISDVEHRITAEQAVELRAYNEQRLAHKAAAQ